MSENISAPINNLKQFAGQVHDLIPVLNKMPNTQGKNNESLNAEAPFDHMRWPQLSGNDILFTDGRKYSIAESKVINDQKTVSMNFSLGGDEIHVGGSHRHNPEEKNPFITGIRVNFLTDGEGNIQGLAALDIDGKKNEKYYGAEIDVFQGGKKFRVRYESIENSPEHVVIASVVDQNGRIIDDLGKIGDMKEQLKLPEKIDIVATAIDLLTTNKSAESMRQKPFIIPDVAIKELTLSQFLSQFPEIKSVHRDLMEIRVVQNLGNNMERMYLINPTMEDEPPPGVAIEVLDYTTGTKFMDIDRTTTMDFIVKPKEDGTIEFDSNQKREFPLTNSKALKINEVANEVKKGLTLFKRAASTTTLTPHDLYLHNLFRQRGIFVGTAPIISFNPDDPENKFLLFALETIGKPISPTQDK